MKKLFCFFIVVLSGTTSPVMGQVVHKKDLDASDYGRWSTVDIAQVSDKGSWVSYNVQYKNGEDTLFVRSRNTSKTYAFPKGFDGKFIGEGYFLCRLPEAALQLVDLKQGKVTAYNGISQYAVSADGDNIISVSGSSLLIHGSKGNLKLRHDGVGSFSLSPDSDALCYTAPEGVFLIEFSKQMPRQKQVSDCNASAFAWQPNGESFAFISTCGTESETVLSLFKIRQNLLLHLETALSRAVGVTVPHPSRFLVSNDGQRVFYSLKGTDVHATSPDVEIWNSSDPIIYSEKASKGDPATYEKVAVWWADKQMAFRLTDSIKTSIFLSGDQRYAFTYNPRGTTPHFDDYPLTDYYITDLATKETKLFLLGHTVSQADITASPDGRYIAYRKNNAWWLYAIRSAKHIQLSGISPAFDAALPGNSLWEVPSVAGWSEGDKKMFFFDDFDLWAIDTENLTFTRLTQGREKGIRYRPANREIGMQHMNFDGFILPEIDDNAVIKLVSVDSKSKKAAFYIIAGKRRKILEADKSLTQPAFSRDNSSCYYVEQAYSSPPAIRHLDHKGRNTLIYQSNPQHEDYYWGNVELVSYRNSKNDELQGLLYYPANYDPLKKYPMVVYIYEKVSHSLHNYINPGKTGYTGFNITNLVTQGYFVLCPDISYRIGDVGISAADCVTSATRSIISKDIIDECRIALFGHSFGGYEAAFIATQTSMFATIIAGAAFTDLQSAYLGISDNRGLSHMWRFEYQQWRMGKSIFEIPKDYRRNSVVEHTEKISTPLLLFSGKKDGQVDFRQSRELYLALRRMGKPAIMLLYPEEGHVLMKEKNQIDFTGKLEDWLAYFLKNAPPPSWMKNEFSK